MLSPHWRLRAPFDLLPSLSLKLILMSALRTIFFKRTMESETSATHNNHHVTAGDGASRSRWSNGWLGRLARAMASRQPGRWARAMPRGMARAMARRMARGMAPGNADDFCVRLFLDNVSANFAKKIVRKNCTQNCTQNCPRNCPHHSEKLSAGLR